MHCIELCSSPMGEEVGEDRYRLGKQVLWAKGRSCVVLMVEGEEGEGGWLVCFKVTRSCGHAGFFR